MKLILGNCLQELKKLPDNSIDSIVTDPPYELGFMGKSWDKTGIANNVEMWKECLRVLKPGGHLLAFSGTRTYHRMTSAIEDAGFEVRDMIEWVYGCLSEDTEILTANGWETLNSLFKGDYVFACDYQNDMKLQLEPVKQKFIYDYDEDAYHIKDTGYYNSSLMETDHIVSRNHNVLVLESWIRNNGFGNDLYYEKIQAEKLYEYIKKTNGKQTFRIPGLNGDIPCTIEKIPYKGKVWCVEVESGAFVARRNGKIFITGNSGFPKSLNIGKAVDKLQGNEREVIGEENKAKPTFHSQNVGGEISEIDNIQITKGTSEWEGWGTATKPAHEPICMARKPLSEKTVAENVLKWGTGGINIDESRVGKREKEQFTSKKTGSINAYGDYFYEKSTEPLPSGRFPANLLHDNSEEVRECFPNKSERFFKSIYRTEKDIEPSEIEEIDKELPELFREKWVEINELYKNGDVYEDFSPIEEFIFNIIQFYKNEPKKKSIIYTSKASKKERNMGCEDLKEKQYSHDGREKEIENPYQRNKSVAKNNHPTVKPIALMEYLIKMVTRKGGTVLDPFMGSGSTGVATIKNGFQFIGIELDPDYIKIANARIKNTPVSF